MGEMFLDERRDLIYKRRIFTACLSMAHASGNLRPKPYLAMSEVGP